MPPDVPAPEACEGIEIIYEKLLRETTDEKVKGLCRTTLEVSRTAVLCSTTEVTWSLRNGDAVPSRSSWQE